MDEKDLKVEVPSELEKGTDIDTKETEVFYPKIQLFNIFWTQSARITGVSHHAQQVLLI